MDKRYFFGRLGLGLLMGGLVASARPAQAWFDRTHMAVLEASGAPYLPCLAVAPDVVALKLPRYKLNHFSNLVTPSVSSDQILEQVARYDGDDVRGHLYGAVVAAYRQVLAQRQQGRRAAYAFGFLAHYVGDLSQPLHNSVYDEFNAQQHRLIDGFVDQRQDLVDLIGRRKDAYLPTLGGEQDLLVAIANVANAARAADLQLRAGLFTENDCLELLARSAGLLQGIHRLVEAAAPDTSSPCKMCNPCP